MARLVGFFLGTLVVLHLLRLVPVIGGLFHGLLGFWLAAIVFAAVVSKATDAALSRRKLEHAIRALGAVDQPHNQGKLGALLVNHGRFARALPHLERASAGEPDFAEWHYRRGQALLRTGQAQAAVGAFERTRELDDEYAYGGVQLALARARLACGDFEGALEAVECFERNHGPNPESAYWRGLIYKRTGQSAQARAGFREVHDLAARAARFQRREHRTWVWKAWLARVF